MPVEQHDVLIIGAGFAGLGLAIKLRAQGNDDFRILEKNSDLGGTWHENTYPGAACDIPSPTYSYSFEQDFDWPRFYSGQADINRYQWHCADKYDLNRHIDFKTEVAQAKFEDSSCQWLVTTTAGRQIRCAALVSATGMLNRPATPTIDGLENFAGHSFHSARWDHRHALQGKRVAVVGSGASAVQLFATVARQSDKALLFQRSANYVLPKPDRRLSRPEHWLLRNVPGLRQLVRGTVYCLFESTGIGLFKWRPFVYPLVGLWKLHLRLAVKDPVLRDKLRPTYGFGCRRILFDNTFYRALNRDNVSLVTSGIHRIEPNAVITDDGQRHEVDSIIFATGFQASSLLAPMKIIGRGGLNLADSWKEGPQAWRGLVTHGFPNFFMLYGPNTNLGHNSIIYMLESQIRFITGALQVLRVRPGEAMDVRADLQQSFNRWLQTQFTGTAWLSGCSSWYINEQNKIVTLWSGFTFRYRNLVRRFQPAAFEWIDAEGSQQTLSDSAIDYYKDQAPSLTARLCRPVVSNVLKPFLSPGVSISMQRIAVDIATRTLPPAIGAQYRLAKGAPVPIEVAMHRHGGGRSADESKAAILYVHGGAFVLGSPRSHRSIVGRLARHTGLPTYSVDYRLAPEHPWPAPLNDVEAAWNFIRRSGLDAKDIAIAGDSAGANLALLLALRLRDAGLEKPGCLALISPWADLGNNALSDVNDALLSREWLALGASQYLGGQPSATSSVSPLFADLSALPPTLIHTAGRELLINDAIRLHQAFRVGGSQSDLQIFPGLWHDFQLYAGLIPEATESVEALAAFISRRLQLVGSDERRVVGRYSPNHNPVA